MEIFRVSLEILIDWVLTTKLDEAYNSEHLPVIAFGNPSRRESKGLLCSFVYLIGCSLRKCENILGKVNCSFS